MPLSLPYILGSASGCTPRRRMAGHSSTSRCGFGGDRRRSGAALPGPAVRSQVIAPRFRRDHPPPLGKDPAAMTRPRDVWNLAACSQTNSHDPPGSRNTGASAPSWVDGELHPSPGMLKRLTLAHAVYHALPDRWPRRVYPINGVTDLARHAELGLAGRTSSDRDH